MLDPYLVIYNRIPKSGSTSLLRMIDAASKTNHFRHVSTRDYMVRNRTDSEERAIVNALLERSVRRRQRLVYDQHMYWIDVAKYARPGEAERVAFINMVREPLSLVGSNFYWIPTQCACVDKPQSWCAPAMVADKQTCGHTLESWFEYNAARGVSYTKLLSEVGGMHMSPAFLCGHSASPWQCARESQHSCPATHDLVRCASDGVAAGRYAVVGLMEDVNLTMAVLATTLPAFFGQPFSWRQQVSESAAHISKANPLRGPGFNASMATRLSQLPAVQAVQGLYHSLRLRLEGQMRVHQSAESMDFILGPKLQK